MTDNLKYRLENAALTPPENAWNNIMQELELGPEHHLTLKLQQAELAPPAQAWGIIEASLNKGTGRLVPMSAKWQRYAVAAIAIGVIVFAGILNLKSDRQTTNNSNAALTVPNTGEPQAASSPRLDNSGNLAAAGTAQASSRLVAIARPNVFNFIADRYWKPQPMRVRYANVDEAEIDNGEDQLSPGDEIVDRAVTPEPRTAAHTGNYLTVPAPNGEPAKISSKLTDGVGYVYATTRPENIDMAIKSISWQMKFSNWSNKLMANSSFIPAATNFFDIMELEALLNEQ